MIRTLDDLPIEIILKDIRRGNAISTDPATIANIKNKVGKTWKSTTVGRGGWLAATAQWDGQPWEMEEFFTNGLMREIEIGLGGDTLWQGFLGKMILKRANGETFIRDWSQVYNKWKSIYKRIGDNLLSDGSAESAAWSAEGTPSTLEQSTAWVSDGVYSCHIVTDAADEGAIIGTTTIVAAKPYQAKVNVNIVSGDWFLEIYRDDTGATIAQAGEGETGEFVLSTSLTDKNTYSGTVGVRLVCDDVGGGGEIYGDGAVFQAAPYQAQTSWYEDSASPTRFGTKENIILLGGSSQESAAVKAQSALRQFAWARSLPPDNFTGYNRLGETTLDLFFLGYVTTLNNTYAETTGTDAASDHISAMIDQAEFIEPGIVETNSHNFQIDPENPLRVWDVIEDIILDGDASGDLWEGGVYGGRKFYYTEVEDVARYAWQGGQLLDGRAVVEPWLARPGYVKLEEMPLGPEQISGYDTDDPRVVYMFEVELDLADWLAGGTGLRWRRDTSHE